MSVFLSCPGSNSRSATDIAHGPCQEPLAIKSITYKCIGRQIRRRRQTRRAQSAGYDGLGALANAELAQPAAQRARIETEDAGSAALAFDHPTGAFQHAPDMRAFHF